jgi:glycosyltransferase involved in cell wall biosynthesis
VLPPKTLHFTNFYHAKSGGIGAFYRALLRYANDHDRLMRLVVPGEQSGSEEIGSYGRIYQVKAPRAPAFDRRYRLILPFGSTAAEIIRILRAEQADVLEISDKYTLPYFSGMLRKNWVRGVNRPTEIATCHERLDDNVAAHVSSSTVARWLSRLYVRCVYFPMFDLHIANSEYTAAELFSASRGHNTRRPIVVCPMGIDAGFFAAEPRSVYNGKCLLYSGRLSAEKNTALLIEMLALLPKEYSLVLAGEGPQREWLLAEAERRVPGRVTVYGHLASREDYAQLLRSVDAFIHPNPHEPFGMTPLEAMAAGLPLVAPRSGGVLSYANDDNAWLSSATAKAFAVAVLSLFSDDHERLRRIQNARITAAQHDWSSIAGRYFDLLDSFHHAMQAE